jgi:hypothetical protein
MRQLLVIKEHILNATSQQIKYALNLMIQELGNLLTLIIFLFLQILHWVCAIQLLICVLSIYFLGILPHTVQLYRFDDPSSDTYGNADFMAMFNFTFFAAPTRDTIYFGETAYWVNYDINVPLFLPLYGQARLYDLRMIAFNEEKTNIKIKGLLYFINIFNVLTTYVH